MKAKLFALIETRKIIALYLAGIFGVMMLRGDITTDQGLPLISLCIGYYFGGSTARDNPKKPE